jgi:lysozyme
MKQSQGISTELIALIKDFEGYSDKAYVDPSTGDKPITIGYGSTRWLNNLPIQLGQFIDKTLAEKLLIRDILDTIKFLKINCPNFNSFNVNQQNALISFSYNTGYFYGKDNYDTLNRAILNKDLKLIPKSLMLYIDKGLPSEQGLINRRKREVALFNKVV